MKKLLTILFSIITLSANAQFGGVYNPLDSSYTNIGGWSLVKMYVQKDSTANPDSYYIKFYQDNVHFMKHYSRNNGKPTGIMWLDNVTAKLNYSPIDSIKLGQGSIIGLSSTFNNYYTKTQSDSRYLQPFGNGSSLTGLTKSQVGLNNIDNTTDLNKPISTATQTALNGKLSSEVDGSITNEIQTLSLSGSNLSISSGNSVALPSIIVPTYNFTVIRPVNSTSFTPSTSQSYRVYYNVEVSCTASIGGASSGSVVLQYYNGSSWVNSGGVIKNSNTVTLAIVLNSVTVQGGTISGEFPANTQLRLVSTSAGTTTITYNTGQEVLY